MPEAPFPPRIGRYDIVGRLASGGMAEVLLGRLRGPHGFERPLVIKRILPHLSLDRTIVDLFLDEARIIANLRHPNLIHVHELGRDGDEFFLAMEYLEAESISGLCRRLAARHELLDPNLAAHVVAEACAGLHAAHEATSSDGRRLEIVHRDVSPQNILIAYSGAVHVIDFGIATAVDRISRTEAGTVRGKFEYLAPEQLRSQPIDRRADVFALGIVLFELTSGRRLFRRASQAESLLAILNEPVPKLRALRPDAPPELETLCARALGKNAGDRFQTAAEMRRELVAFARRRTDDDLGERLGVLMRELFSDRVAEKASTLRQVRGGAEVETLPAAEVDITVELPSVAADPGTVPSQSLPIRSTADGPPSWSRGRWMVLPSLALAIGVALSVWSLASRRPSAPASVNPTPSTISSAVNSAVDLVASSSATSTKVIDAASVVAAPTPIAPPAKATMTTKTTTIPRPKSTAPQSVKPLAASTTTIVHPSVPSAPAPSPTPTLW